MKRPKGSIIKRLDIIEDLCRDLPHLHEYREIAPVINRLIFRLRYYFVNGHPVHLSKLGNLTVKTHKVVCNLRGHKTVMLANKVVKFKAGPKLRNELNNAHNSET